MIPRFYGWIQQTKDDRDFKFTSKLKSLPTSFDLSPNMGPQLDQEDLGSCGPNSAAEMVDYDQKAEKHLLTPPSRLFIYYTTRSLMGTTNQDSGVDNRTLLKALNKYGYCPESQWPYD